MSIKFGDWLSEKLVQLDMKPADLTRASGLDSGVLSNILNNKRQTPAVETCKAIATALAPQGVTLEEIYRAAGILPERTKADATEAAIASVVSGLPATEKEEILRYARFRYHNANHNKKIRQGTASRTASA